MDNGETPEQSTPLRTREQITQAMSEEKQVTESVAQETKTASFQPSPENDSKLSELLKGDPDFIHDTQTLEQLKALDTNNPATDEQRQAAQVVLHAQYDKFRIAGSTSPDKNKTQQSDSLSVPHVEIPLASPNPHWREEVRTSFLGDRSKNVDPKEEAKMRKKQEILEKSNLRSNNAHEILGISNDPTNQEIKEAYRILAGHYHPDVSREDPIKFLRVKKAFDVLYVKGRDEPSQPPPTRETPYRQQTQARRPEPSTSQPPRSERPQEKTQGPSRKESERPVEPGEYGRVKNQIDSATAASHLPDIFSLSRLSVTEPQRDELIAMRQKKHAAFIMDKINSDTNAYQLVGITSLEISAERNEIGSHDLEKLVQAVQKKRFDFLISEIETAQKSYNLPSPLSLDVQLTNKEINQTQHTELMRKLRQKNFQFLLSEITNATQSWDLPNLITFDLMARRGEITSQQASELTSSVNAKKKTLS